MPEYTVTIQRFKTDRDREIMKGLLRYDVYALNEELAKECAKNEYLNSKKSKEDTRMEIIYCAETFPETLVDLMRKKISLTEKKCIYGGMIISKGALEEFLEQQGDLQIKKRKLAKPLLSKLVLAYDDEVLLPFFKPYLGISPLHFCIKFGMTEKELVQYALDNKIDSNYANSIAYGCGLTEKMRRQAIYCYDPCWYFIDKETFHKKRKQKQMIAASSF